MENYIPLNEYARFMEIEPGDIIFVSSDARKLMWDALSNRSSTDLNHFIDGLIEAVGPEGTVIFPTYNWDFCSGTPFNYQTTPCKTGTLGTLALKRADFKRTKHPIYSFAVWGKYQAELYALENKDSFGLDSPFAFFKEHNIKNHIIDVTLEQHSGVVKHRFVKDFSSGYIDEHGQESLRTYSMFVRDLEMDVQTLIDPIEPDFIAQGAEKQFYINSSQIKCIRMGDAYNILLRDIVENNSRKLCKFKGQ